MPKQTRIAEEIRMKIYCRASLALYLVILVWLLLFKMSTSIPALVEHHHQRSLNLIPFSAPSIVDGRINYSEMIWNCIFFIPFGLLLNVNFKRVEYLSKIVIILCFSLTIELLQYTFAIGATDITDVITNTAGGFLGLTLYSFSNQYVSTEKLDRIIISVGFFLALLFISIHISHVVRRRLWR
jgi:glycopeptide antibiotics resistance protein